MKDKFGREISYLRVSITDRCNLRCFYCIPEEGVEYIPHDEILRYEELLKIIGLFSTLGIRKVRITGGEPFVRKGVIYFLEEVKKIKGIEKVAITTNATMLEQHVRRLKEIGIDGINISIDTLKKEKFIEITKRDEFANVIKGIEAAIEAGLPVKLNTVLMKKNFDEVEDLILFAAEKGVPIRFIELMPFSTKEDWEKEYVPQDDLVAFLEKKWTLKPFEKKLGEGPGKYFYIEELDSIVGFISPISHNFCSSCNRIRLTASGKINPCLALPLEYDIKTPLRNGADDEELLEILKEAILNKPLRHRMNEEPAGKIMRRLGG